MNKKLSLTLGLIALFALALAACGGAAQAPADVDVQSLPQTVDVQTTYNLLDHPEVVVFDVREQWEYDAGHIPGVILLPLNELPSRINEIPTDKEVIITCRTGNRSGQAVDFLEQQGFDNVHNMSGGILAWESAGLPVER